MRQDASACALWEVTHAERLHNKIMVARTELPDFLKSTTSKIILAYDFLASVRQGLARGKYTRHFQRLVIFHGKTSNVVLKKALT